MLEQDACWPDRSSSNSIMEFSSMKANETQRKFGSSFRPAALPILIIGAVCCMILSYKTNVFNIGIERGNRSSINLILQYKVEAGEAKTDILNRFNIPQEFLKGDAMLRLRTYPRNQRQSRCHKCFAYIYGNIIRPKACDAPGKIKLLVVITTVPSARETRDTMRETWLSFTKNNTGAVRYMFLIGSGWPEDQQNKTLAESKEFGDILQDDYIDSYFNLSIKVMSGFKYGITICNQTKYIMRSADDNYVNIPNVMALLEKEATKIQDKMFGACNGGGLPTLREKSSKWAVTKNEWPANVYPAYCFGTTFIMSQAITRKLFVTAENVPYFVIEDVYFGEVAKQGNIKLMNFPDFLLGFPTINTTSTNPCKMNPKWRAVNSIPEKKQSLLWKYCQEKNATFTSLEQ